MIKNLTPAIIPVALAIGSSMPATAEAAPARVSQFPAGEVVANTTKEAIAGLSGRIATNKTVHTQPGTTITWQTAEDKAYGQFESDDNPLVAMVRSGGTFQERLFGIYLRAQDNKPVVKALPTKFNRALNPFSPDAYNADEATEFVKVHFSPNKSYAEADVRYTIGSKVIGTAHNMPVGHTVFKNAG